MSENNTNINAADEKDLNEVLKIRREKLANLRSEGEDPFIVTKFDRTNLISDILDNYDAYEGKVVVLAGRMMSKRVMGKMSFADLRDTSGKIQLCVKRDEMGEEPYKKYKKFDIGDIIGITGEVLQLKEAKFR